VAPLPRALNAPFPCRF